MNSSICHNQKKVISIKIVHILIKNSHFKTFHLDTRQKGSTQQTSQRI